MNSQNCGKRHEHTLPGVGPAQSPRVVGRTPTGGVVWQIPKSDLQIMWAGPGCRLRLGWLLTVGGAVSMIHHPTACESYATEAEATAAVRAFLAAK